MREIIFENQNILIGGIKPDQLKLPEKKIKFNFYYTQPITSGKEFYEINKIDLHIFSTELNKFETVDFSHKTHPDWRIIDVIYCSSALPIVFSPYMKEDK